MGIDASAVLEYYGYTPEPGNTSIYCPFHEDSTPSCSVESRIGMFHCFGCDAKGDIIELIAKIEQVNTLKAMRLFFSIPGSNSDKSERAYVVDKKTSKEATWEAFHFYQSLPETDWSMIDAHYLLDRKLSRETLSYFGVRENSGSIYPYVFPLTKQERFVGYVTRRDGECGKQKYKNSPGFLKSSTLIGDITHGVVAVVEGMIDLMYCYQCGIRNVCASMGGSLSEKQFMQLSQYATEIVSCFDNDEAGRKAHMSLVSMACDASIPVRRFMFPEHKKDVAEIERGELTRRYYLPTVYMDFSDDVKIAS